jgi:hypothetical protein
MKLSLCQKEISPSSSYRKFVLIHQSDNNLKRDWCVPNRCLKWIPWLMLNPIIEYNTYKKQTVEKAICRSKWK